MKKYQQKFDRFVPDYKYNPETGYLEEFGKKDVQASIESFKESCLDVILDKYLNDDFSLKLGDFDVPEDDQVVDCSFSGDFMDLENEKNQLLDSIDELGGFDRFNQLLNDYELKIKENNDENKKEIE